MDALTVTKTCSLVLAAGMDVHTASEKRSYSSLLLLTLKRRTARLHSICCVDFASISAYGKELYLNVMPWED